MLDFGGGCGANVIAFAGYAKKLYGVDISSDALKEARDHVGRAHPQCDFQTIQSTVQDPEMLLQHARDLDVFLNLYVMQSLPSQNYGYRIMKLA